MQPEDTRERFELDVDVRAAYHKSSDAEVPRELHDKILDLARSQPSPNRRRWTLPYLRPLALAACIVIGVLLVVQPNGWKSDDIMPADVPLGGGNNDASWSQPDGRSCDEASRRSATAWRLCIADLEAAGRHNDAAAEQRLLDQTFPPPAPAQ